MRDSPHAEQPSNPMDLISGISLERVWQEVDEGPLKKQKIAIYVFLRRACEVQQNWLVLPGG